MFGSVYIVYELEMLDIYMDDIKAFPDIFRKKYLGRIKKVILAIQSGEGIFLFVGRSRCFFVESDGGQYPMADELWVVWFGEKSFGTV